MNRVFGTDCSIESMFSTMGGWTTQFEINGKKVGGDVEVLTIDPRLYWQMEQIGGIKDKRILELGPMEAAHTKMMIEAGAKEVIAVEGISDCFLRCLIVKEAFQLTNAKFIFGDFCRYIKNYSGEKFDVISAAGVLYHQSNPAQLIYDMSRITDKVFVWSHVAGKKRKGYSSKEVMVKANGIEYRGLDRDWRVLRKTFDRYCASLNDFAVWLYPEEMLRCFKDAGFENINIQECPPNPNGDCLLFIATK